MTEAAEERPGRRQRSLHCKPAEQAMIRERAEAASKTVSRYVMELALADDPDRHPLVLSEEEQAEVAGWGPGVAGIGAGSPARASGRQRAEPAERDLCACTGAGAVSRKRRRRKVGKHISLSATDADWETVRSNANRRGLSIARYLVELVERDASEEDAGLRHECPELTLAAEEQRELLEAVREVRALMLEGEDAGPLVRDMQERIAVMFAAWASAMAGSGRSEELLSGARLGAWRGAGAHRCGLGRGLGRAVCREAGEGSAGRRRKDAPPPGPAAVRQAPSPPRPR